MDKKTCRSTAEEVVGVVITSEPFLQKCKRLAGSKYALINVMNCRAALGWIAEDSKAEFMDRAELAALGIPYEMLVNTIVLRSWSLKNL